MKRIHIILMTAAAVLAAGCCPTRIVTVSPETAAYSYSTTVTVPRTHTMTTTTCTVMAEDDISLYLDLQAVAAAFAQSSTIQEFEMLLNNSAYMLSNLDLNLDGYVDYLRVVETVRGGAHVFVIQDVLGMNVFQDVATLVVEISSLNKYYVQVIGTPYIYGKAYIIQPVFYRRPLIIKHLFKRNYKPWISPWHWNCLPSYYKHPAPIHMSHYSAYVETFMRNHKYCHEFSYATEYHYKEYVNVARSVTRNDYEVQHPERSFSVRNADVPARSAAGQTSARTVVNARDIREIQNASTERNVTSTARKAATTSSTSSRTAGTTTSSGSARAAGTTTTSSSTRTAGTTTTSSSARAAGTTTTSSSTRTAGTTTTSSSARTAGSTASSSNSNQTTVRSRVSTSGSADTKIKTVTPSGSETTTRRTSSSATREAAARSSSSATTSSSTGTSARSSSSSASTRKSSDSTDASSSSRSRTGSGNSSAGRR